MNNNRKDERALLARCKGVFAATSYLLPEPYRDVKDIPRDAYKHKQFAAGVLKEDTTHAWLGEGLPYEDKLMYAKMGLEKKLGFSSSDWPKRDEFSHPIRMQQYRETLKAEARRMAARVPPAPLATQAPKQDPAAARASLVALYDTLHHTAPTGGAAMQRVAKDTNNPTALTPMRRPGPLRSAYNHFFDSHQVTYTRPAHARKPLIRETFVRKNDVGLHLDPAQAERRWL